MKKLFIISTILISGVVLSKTNNRYVDVYEGSLEESEGKMDGDFPAGPGDPVPIDQYIPVLVLAAIGLAAFYGKKKQITE